MYNFLNILLPSLAILCLSVELQAASVSPPLADIQQPAEQHVHHLRDIQIVKDIKAFIQQNPNLRLIRLNKKAPANTNYQTVKYTLGNRVTGDRMVAQYGDTSYYPALKDVSKQVTYPETGTGSIVTSVDINCLQDNTDGNAYVIDGGIQQRFISIVLEAPQTTRFTYNVHVYGTD